MSAARSLVLRSSMKAAVQRPIGLQLKPICARRGYASGHGSAGKSSDLPWIIGSGSVLAAGLVYLVSAPAPKKKEYGEQIQHNPNPSTPPADSDKKDKSSADSKDLTPSEPEPPATANDDDAGTPGSANDEAGGQEEEDPSKNPEAFKKITGDKKTVVASGTPSLPTKKAKKE